MEATSLCTALQRTLLDETSAKSPALPSTFSKEYFDRQFPRSMAIWNASKDQDYARASTIPIEGEALHSEHSSRRLFQKGFVKYAAKVRTTEETLWPAMLSYGISFIE
jgi:hypothetical protein